MRTARAMEVPKRSAWMSMATRLRRSSTPVRSARLRSASSRSRPTRISRLAISNSSLTSGCTSFNSSPTRTIEAFRPKPDSMETTIRSRSEEHTSELQSHSDLHSFPTRRSFDLELLAHVRVHVLQLLADAHHRGVQAQARLDGDDHQVERVGQAPAHALLPALHHLVEREARADEAQRG